MPGPACSRCRDQRQNQPPLPPPAAGPGRPPPPRLHPAARRLLPADRNAPLLLLGLQPPPPPRLLPPLPPWPLRRPAGEAPLLPQVPRHLLGQAPPRLPLPPAGAPRQPAGRHHRQLPQPQAPRQTLWAANPPRPAPPPLQLRVPAAAAPGTAKREVAVEGTRYGNGNAQLRQKLRCSMQCCATLM